jgi:hypothetical protein
MSFSRQGRRLRGGVGTAKEDSSLSSANRQGKMMPGYNLPSIGKKMTGIPAWQLRHIEAQVTLTP